MQDLKTASENLERQIRLDVQVANKLRDLKDQEQAIAQKMEAAKAAEDLEEAEMLREQRGLLLFVTLAIASPAHFKPEF